MTSDGTEQKKKGTFSNVRLSVAQRYLLSDPRRAMMAIGGVACAAAMLYLAVDFLYLQSPVITSGPLSSYHATFEQDCNACHQGFESVSDQKCSVCHEKVGEAIGVYSFAAHQVYRSGDQSRISSTEDENPCYVCHQEHEGRQASITIVPDSRCTPCHAYEAFDRQHPQFEFIVKSLPDDSTLKFTHIRHVKEVVKREQLVDIERACLYCHNPQPDGRSFQPIDFEEHCRSCHLLPATETPVLKMADLNQANPVGALTLASLRSQHPEFATELEFVNPNEFKIKPGNRLSKSPVQHRDPWIMANLKLIRQRLHPQNGIEELLWADGKVSTTNEVELARIVYDDAIATLQKQLDGLRSRPEPEVFREVAMIDSLLRATKRKITRLNGSTQLPATLRKDSATNEVMATDQIAELEEIASDLTQPCQECHYVESANISRVKMDQRALYRAEFNHRAHIIDRRCLDCHQTIPIMAVTDSAQVAPAMDRAAIQNLPGIEKCRDCHNRSASSNRCVTCHYFHPNKTNRSNLLLYLE